jgi:hypothetical protein
MMSIKARASSSKPRSHRVILPRAPRQLATRGTTGLLWTLRNRLAAQAFGFDVRGI